jgi:hypothetical protein
VVGSSFDDAPRDHTDVYVFGEIVSATRFDAEALYLEYSVVLPTGWKWRAGSQDMEHGATHVRGF